MREIHLFLRKRYLLKYLIFLLSLVILSCGQEYQDKSSVLFNNYRIKGEFYQIEDGFELQVASCEPFIEAPVSMDFDNKGRMWVVEMKGYMQNLEGTEDEVPNGTITILEDFDGDGETDNSKIFIDSLVLPRAIAHVYGGLLYAEPPNLWFVDIVDDKPQNRVLVDSLYADGGNVEHQPNGLMMNIDNWIYSAKSNSRYQRKNNKWLKEPTTFRGQWGISKDNFGRLYYNHNSNQLMGDYVLPNTTINNPYYIPSESVSRQLAPNQNVFPLHPTSVNRGYVNGVLNKDSVLVNVTSACGPLIYRGDKFKKEYIENAFICAPEANLIKRNILSFNKDNIKANQAVPKKEFLASTDEGFRPVNLNNGPDGNMYIVDMHRGIIQDKVYLTKYLKKRLKEKQLDTIVGMGRILRVVNKNNTASQVINLEKLSIDELVNLLSHTNGWIRDRVQQLLIYKNDKSSILPLERTLYNLDNPLAQIHALYTLDGFNALELKVLEKLLNSNSSSNVICHALRLFESFASHNRVDVASKLFQKLISKNDNEVDLYLLNSLGGWMKFSSDKMYSFAIELSNRHKSSLLHQECLISSLVGIEEEFQSFVKKNHAESVFYKNILFDILEQSVLNKDKNKKNDIHTDKSDVKDSRTTGYTIFKNFCATCHGIDGKGIENLAPPLRNSEYVTGPPERLALVILHGLSGPIHVNGKLYKLKGTMPGLINNPSFSDEDIQSVIYYLTNSFSDEFQHMSVDKIKALREQKPENGEVYTEKELMSFRTRVKTVFSF